MPIKIGTSRFQTSFFCLDTAVAQDSEVRLIDAFVEACDLTSLLFVAKGKSKEGRPAFSNKVLLKLYLYGYLNRTRSSRSLEKLARTNMEVLWLLDNLQPCYVTINSFRSINKRGLVKLFRAFNRFLKGEGLFDEELVATDGTKIRAQNSKKNNYNEKKVKNHLDYIDKQVERYLEELDLNDSQQIGDDTEERRLDIAEKLEQLKTRKDKYLGLKNQIEQAHNEGETQISTTDKDARALPKKMNIVEVGYNIVATAEAKNKFITNIEVLNKADTYALSVAAVKAKAVLGKGKNEKIKILADKGFDTGLELKKCSENNIETYVSPKKRMFAGKDIQFGKARFLYNHEEDYYLCPQNEKLKSNGRTYNKNAGKLRKAYKIKRYKLPFSVCNACPFKEKCAGTANLKKSKGRNIERNEHEDYVEQNIERVSLNKPLYRKRQELIEHPFGTVKRQWGYDYTLLKGKAKVRGEYSLIFTVYNLRRAISIFGVKVLINRLKSARLLLKTENRTNFKPVHLMNLKTVKFAA